VTVWPASSPLRMPSDSARRATRTAPESNARPSMRFSAAASGRPAPMPSSKRPPDSTSSVAASLASITGWRTELTRTYMPTRSFPDRESLMRGLALDILGRAAHEARAALADEPDPSRALARYMHRALDLRISAVMPALLGRISFDDAEVSQARQESVEPVLRM